MPAKTLENQVVFQLKRAQSAGGAQLFGGNVVGSASKPNRPTPLRTTVGCLGVAGALLLSCVGPAAAQRGIAVPAANAAAPMPAISLASHRAVYDVKLVRATQADGVRSAYGTSTYVLTDRCDGYTVESSMHLDMGMSNGSDSIIDQRYAAWEAKDNRSASFRMLTHENGHLKDSYHGSVTLDANGAGKATYVTADETKNYDLPAGTLLSTGHLVDLLTSAATGKTLVNREVIDGSFDDGPYRIAAVVGPQTVAPAAVADTGGLENGAISPIALAYFAAGSSADVPAYELTMDLYPNGVARRMVQDFGEFTLAFELQRVEPVTGPSCGATAAAR
jgi:hypothetical protein